MDNLGPKTSGELPPRLKAPYRHLSQIGVFLEEDYGGPVRVFCPYLWGYKSAKSVVKIELMDHYEPGFWELRGYSDFGKIKAGKVIDINDARKVKKIPDGEVIDFME